ncbi:MAG TPA: two-component regulator propeller domain-containing protein, partial [Flavisolibacter sp.]|nr:two-component regulator propeller domain-containing protein [Flavisolibacter sp.]
MANPGAFIQLSSQPLFLTVLFLLLCSASASGQQLHFKHFTVDDGLPSNEVYQVLQDTSGKLLIATDRGAVQYDGYSFHPISLKNKLTSKPVYYIYRSPKGQIYFSSLQGNIYQYHQDTLHDFPFNSRTASLFQHPGILIANSISAQRDTVWISFNNDYNYNYKIGSCFVTANGTVGKIAKEDGLYFDLARRFHYRQSSPASNSNPKQPLTITWENGQITRDEVSLNWRSAYIRRLFQLRCGEYDLFSIGRHLFVYKDQKKVSSYLFPENVLQVTSLRNNEIYVGFENTGAGLYRLQEGEIRGPAENYLSGYSVTSIFQDNQGGLWLSTLENGLFYSYPSKPRLWNNPDKIVHIEKRKEKTYVGFNSGAIQIFNGNQLAEESRLPLMPGGFFLRLSFDHNDSPVAITDKGYFVREKGQWRYLSGNDILLSSAGEHLVYGASSNTAELRVYDGLGKPLRQKQQLSKRIISMHVRQPEEVWIGTWDGLLKYDHGRLTDMTKVSPVFNDRIVSIGELPGKDLVVASLGKGLAVYKNNKVYPLNISNGLRSPIINSMVVQQDSIWIGSNQGLTLALFEKDSFRTVHLGLESGLPTLNIHQFSVNNGWLYIKWVNNLVVLPVAGLLRTDTNTRTNITSVVVNERIFDPLSKGNFSHNENALTLQFTCINLSSASQQEFVYQLAGFDKTWHRTKERYVKYTNVPPGTYQFQVRAV